MSLAAGIPQPKSFAPEPEWKCSRCRDKGWVMTNPARRAYSRCSCQSVSSGATLNDYLQHTGMESSEISMAQSPWNEAVKSRTRSSALFTADTWGKGVSTPLTIALLGVTGSGKTMTAAHCVAEYLYAGGRKVKWLHVPTATRLYLAMAPGSRYEMDQHIQGHELVVFDEAGATKDQFSDIWMGWFFGFVRAEKKIILTSNASDIGEFEARVSSRLREGVRGKVGDEDFRGAEE